MILIEQTQVPDTALPVAAFRDHLQLGSGFADDGLQDAVLIPQLRAALATIESKTGKVMIARGHKLVVTAWRHYGRQVLPVAPVTEITAFSIVDLSESVELIAPETYQLRADRHSPVLMSLGSSLPTIPVGGTAEIEFDAGFEDWDAAPDDLKQAVLMLATHYYENRGATGARGSSFSLPLSVAAICRRHTPIRIDGVRRP